MAPPHANDLTRRRFLQTASAAGLLTALQSRGAGAESSATLKVARGRSARARNLVFMVSDGMSMGTLTLAEYFANVIENRTTAWAELLAGSVPGVLCGLQDTASANSLVTDSAAAASAWSCGHRLNNDVLNITPDGVAREPILVTARRAGKATGVVTTTRATHATPAGFIATIDSRNKEDEIAAQYFEREIDLCLAGGRKHFSPTGRLDARDLEAEFTARGHTVVHDRAGLAAVPESERKVLGLFWDDHLPYMVDRLGDPDRYAAVPTLPELTRTALSRLAREPNGFVLQVEGGRVDHACHDTDAAGAIREQLDFDAAITVVIEFQREHPDTLVVVTSDHGNGNPGLNADSLHALNLATAKPDEHFIRVRNFKASFATIFGALKPEMEVEEVQRRLVAGTDLPITGEQAEVVREALAGRSTVPYRGMRNAKYVFSEIAANYHSIGWSGHWHTADYVVFSAFGPGSETFPNLVRNDVVHGHLLDALGMVG